MTRGPTGVVCEPENRRHEESSPSSADDPVRARLEAIGAIPMLTVVQEIYMAQRFEAGLAARELLDASARDGRHITPAERRRLQRVVRSGRGAKRRLAEANLRVVARIALLYVGRGMCYLDLIDAGTRGLMRAVDVWDWTKGYRFSTYSTFWIRLAISFEMSNRRFNQAIPEPLRGFAYEVLETYWQLFREWADDPTAEEIAEVMRIPAAPVQELLWVIRCVGVLGVVKGASPVRFEGYLLKERE